MRCRSSRVANSMVILPLDGRGRPSPGSRAGPTAARRPRAPAPAPAASRWRRVGATARRGRQRDRLLERSAPTSPRRRRGARACSIASASAAPGRRACPADSTPAATATLHRGRQVEQPQACWRSAGGTGAIRAGELLVGRSRSPASSCWYAAASSSGFSWLRCRFSSSASRSSRRPGVSRTIAGIVASPAAWLRARQRRSPMTSSKRSPGSSGRTTGCSSPTSRIEPTSSCELVGVEARRGWRGLARRGHGISVEPHGAGRGGVRRNRSRATGAASLWAKLGSASVIAVGVAADWRRGS